MVGTLAMEWTDGKTRCQWANPKNERYICYHDKEWGIPVYDDHTLFEMLVLEGFQAGLTWECVLNKRESFRKAFDGFDLETVSGYDEQKMQKLKENPDIIRNARKIHAAVSNAEIFRQIQASSEVFPIISGTGQTARPCMKQGWHIPRFQIRFPGI